MTSEEARVNSCPLCGVDVSGERPRYNVSLEARDRSRSGRHATPNTCAGRFRRQVCVDCWEGLEAELSERPSND